ncbi:hypothetical protein ECEC96038_3386 [Escherichia coli EC96038]|nr:hypothetical protein ECEC96038_3386 [Escherichia coli EC96038]
MVNAAQRTRVKVEADSRPSVDTHPSAAICIDDTLSISDALSVSVQPEPSGQNLTN